MYSNIKENSWKTADSPDSRYSVQVRTYAYPAAGAPVPAEAERLVVTDNTRPYVKQVEVKQGTITVYKSSWAVEGALLRSYKPIVETPLTSGIYTVITTFSEPMHEASLVGINYAFSPYDTVQISTLTIGGYTQDAILPLEIRGSDIAGTANSILLIEPGRSYIDPARELTRDAAGGMQGTGGPDRFHSLRIEAAPPVIEYEDRNHILSHSCGGTTCGTQAEPINLNWNLVRFRYTDIGSGIKNITIRKDTLGGPVERAFTYAPHVYTQDISSDIADGLHVHTVTDNSGNTTTMWFRVDPESPKLEISSITMSSGFNTFSVYGVVRDTASGMDFLKLNRGDALIKDFGVTRGSKDLISFISPPLTVDAGAAPEGSYYVFSAQDKAGNGSFPQPIFQFFKADWVEAGQTAAVANYISEVKAGGEPCTITITSTRNSSPVPVEYDLDVDSMTIFVGSASLEARVVATPGRYFYGNLKVNVTPQICDEYGNCHGACWVSLAGQSVLGLANGPAQAFVRNGTQPAEGVKFYFEWHEITFFNLRTDEGDKLTMENVVSPEAPGSYVVYPPGVNRSLRLKYEGAEYTGIKIKTCGLPPGAAAGMRMTHYADNGAANDITTAVEGDCLTGYSTTASRFSAVAPISMYDNAGPVVDFRLRDAFETGGLTYISSSSLVELAAEDRSSNTFALAGVASTYYLLDEEPTPACLGTAYNANATPGSCPNPLYNGPFRLNEGIR
ncbi:MAG: hypothetical protein Q8O90_02495, partial [Elusimicrobiota bacterium]|nr:hypothetical protein [Elusimicrobiota bacterium]